MPAAIARIPTKSSFQETEDRLLRLEVDVVNEAK
jgi:hypothetical protein